MRYRDVAAASDWLCEAFGFQKQTVLTGDDGAPVYAQLTMDRAMLMLAPVRDTVVDKLMRQPDEIGGAETQSGYYVVADADAHAARAKAAGASIILDVEDDDFGGRSYTCRDPEGHIWTFGTYDPWQGRFPEPAVAPAAAASGGRRVLLGVLTAAMMAVVGVAGWYGGALTQSGAVSPANLPPQAAAPGGERGPDRSAALAAAEEAAREARAQLERERAARLAADKSSEEAQKRAAEAQQARQAAERTVKETRAELERERATKAAAAAGSADVQRRLEEEARAREAAERAIKEVRAELEKVRADKVAAEMAKEFALGRAEEEQAGREAAERAAEEARAKLEQRAAGQPAAAPSGAAGGPDPNILKGKLPAALEEARKRAVEAQQAREEADRALKEMRTELEKERASKNAAWKVVGQLTKQLKQVQSASSIDDDAPPAKKVRPKAVKKAPDPD